MNISTLCRILVRLSLVTPEFTLLKKLLPQLIRQKLAYHAKYLGISWTNLYLLYRFGRHMGGNGYADICLTVAQGTLLWQPVKLRDRRRRRHRQQRPLHFLWRSTTNPTIKKPLSKDLMAIIRLHQVQIW